MHAEIHTLHQKEREQDAKLDQAIKRLSIVESQVYDDRSRLNNSNLADVGALRANILDKLEDLRLRQDQDLSQSHSRLSKRIDELQLAINGIGKNNTAYILSLKRQDDQF